jgi:glycogen debranching enzyme
VEPSPFAGTRPVANIGQSDGTVTLVEGQTFFLSAPNGDISADLPHGLFVLDTRVLSRWELRVNGRHLEPLAVELDDPYAATFVARCQPSAGHADADLVVFRYRHIGQGMRERLVVTNHGLDPLPVTLELACGVDFAGLFEVKESRVRVRGSHSHELDTDTLRFGHRHGESTKEVSVRFSVPTHLEPGLAAWRTTLEPGQSWEVCAEVAVTVGETRIRPRFTCDGSDAEAVPVRRLEHWRAELPDLDTDDAALASAFRRSGEDLGALRIFDPERPDVPILAAGAPWFMTVFGRDSLLTAWMTLLADSSLARGVLETLARFQGSDVDPATEEEPGKILHEMRFGSASGPALGRGDVYYGSIDATPLFVMVLGELRRWDPSDDLVDQLLPHADRALEWIERFGDRDGDGYVEYQRHNDDGLANQGWKDSWDAVRHADGRLAKPPIALCEVQGYVYAAYVARAHLAREAGDAATYERYAAKAWELRRRFNEDFWLDEQGTFALALDADKKPVAVVASNVGHCLWTGIVEPDRAPLVAERLVADDMFSGWGIRTLARSMRAYNPVSYHNGSVWPHDNALCAAGLARYDCVEEANRVLRAQLDVAALHGGRLPELFAGFSRQELSVPASYPTSCSPQAWAAAAPVLWLRTMLRLEPWATHGQVWLHPDLPPGIGRLRVDGIRIGGHRVTVSVEGSDVEIEGTGDLEVIHQPRPPLTATFDSATGS